MNTKRINNGSFAIKLSLFGLLAVAMLNGCSKKRSGVPNVLVFSKTAAFHHQSISAGNEALIQLGSAHGFHVDTTTDAAWFNEATLNLKLDYRSE